jgi:hypothetical protein
MRAIYDAQPVTKQEAMHLVKYLEEVSADPAPPSNVSLHVAGIGGTVLVLVLLGKLDRRRAAGTRARMVADASRRNDRAGNRGRTTDGLDTGSFRAGAAELGRLLP